MNKRIISSASMLLLATPFCYASGYTLTVANHIIVVLVIIVIVLIVMGCYGIHYNKVISQRNEQLRRILLALDEYRATVSKDSLSPGEQKEELSKDKDQNFFSLVQEVSGKVQIDFRLPGSRNPIQKRNGLLCG